MICCISVLFFATCLDICVLSAKILPMGMLFSRYFGRYIPNIVNTNVSMSL